MSDERRKLSQAKRTAMACMVELRTVALLLDQAGRHDLAAGARELHARVVGILASVNAALAKVEGPSAA